MKKLLKFLTLVLGAILLVSSVMPIQINADGNSIKDIGIEISDTDMRPLALSAYTSTDFENLETQEIEGVTYYVAEPNTEYVTRWDGGLDYFGKNLTVVITTSYVYDNVKPEEQNPLLIRLFDSKKTISLNPRGGLTGDSITIANQISIFDEDGNPFNFVGLLGINDPDESNYEINGLSSRGIYYKDGELINEQAAEIAPEYASEYYFVEGDQLVRYYVDGSRASSYDRPTANYNNANFYVEMKGESSITLKSLDSSTGAFGVPYFYSINKEYSITYKNLKGADNENPDTYTSGNAVDISDPGTIEGYTFKGWEEGNRIEPWDFGDKEFTAIWEPYTYKINYEGNGAENEMSPSNFTFEHSEFLSKENAFENPGYKFIGFKLEGREELITSPEDFREILVEMGDGSEITLIAQWEMEKYPINYVLDGGTNNSDNPVEYTIEDEKDILDPKKEGYKFLGWQEGNRIEKGSTGEKTFTALWEQNHSEIYNFVSSNESKMLPQEVLSHLPTRSNMFESGQTVYPAITNFIDVVVSDGVWHFTGWDNESVVMEHEDVVFTGTWSFIKNEPVNPDPVDVDPITPEPKPIVEPDPEPEKKPVEYHEIIEDKEVEEYTQKVDEKTGEIVQSYEKKTVQIKRLVRTSADSPIKSLSMIALALSVATALVLKANKRRIIK